MLNTAKELHIGIDLGLQAINSNRKLNIEPAEKDWVLNTTMMQEINNKINAKSNAKQEGFEDTYKRIDDLESIKMDTSELENFPIYEYSDKAVFVPLPPDYYRLIGSSADVNNLGTVKSPVVSFKDLIGGSGLPNGTGYGIIKLPSSSISDYSDFKITFCYNCIGDFSGSLVYDEEVLFNMNELAFYADYVNDPLATYYPHGANELETPYYEGKFQFIRMVLDHVNEHTGKEFGVKLYWERFTHIYQKDCFIMVIDYGLVSQKITGFNVNTGYAMGFLTPSGSDANWPDSEDTYGVITQAYYDESRNSNILKFDKEIVDNTSFYSVAEKAAYEAVTFDDYPVRIVKTSERRRLNKHYYGRTVFDSPLGEMKQGRLIVYHDGTFEFNRLDLEYYRRPKLISLLNNQGCEIASDSFRMELVDKTVQKLSARIQDPNYKNLLQENLILE